MPKLHFITPEGNTRTIDAPEGQSVMTAATDQMIPGIIGECGGCCACATCHVYVDEQWFDKLPPPDELELDLLEGTLEPRPNSRLSCQINVSQAIDGLVLRIPADQ